MVDGYGKLAFAEVDKAPAQPGLYAWYGAIYISIADYKREMDTTGRDTGVSRLRSVLARHLARYQSAPFDLVARGTFGADWRGALEDASGAIAQEVVRGTDPSVAETAELQGFAKMLSSSVATERHRALLSKVLERAAPVLTSPIYIGVTSDLRQRLKEHTDTYRNLRDAVTGNDEALAVLRRRLRREGLSFAARAVAMDFQPEHLHVYTMDVGALSDDKTTPGEMRDIAGTAEWLLNRWHRPVAGRR